jgi:hypothetical protein
MLTVQLLQNMVLMVAEMLNYPTKPKVPSKPCLLPAGVQLPRQRAVSAGPLQAP